MRRWGRVAEAALSIFHKKNKLTIPARRRVQIGVRDAVALAGLPDLDGHPAVDAVERWRWTREER